MPKSVFFSTAMLGTGHVVKYAGTFIEAVTLQIVKTLVGACASSCMTSVSASGHSEP